MNLNLHHDRRWERKNSQSWRAPKLNRSRRPLLLAVLCIALIVYWRHPLPDNPSIPGHPYTADSHVPATSRDRRSLSHEIQLQSLPLKPDVRQQAALLDISDQVDVSEEVKKPKFLHEQEASIPDVELKQAAAVPAPVKVQDTLPLPVEHTQEKTSHREATEERLAAQPPTLNLESLPKGPVAVEAQLDPDTQGKPLIASPDQPVKEKVIETEPEEHLTLEEKADNLPELVHVPFEDAVKDMQLKGWEDQWVAHASFDVKTWGKLEEPKIDFVYLCQSLHMACQDDRLMHIGVNGSEEAFQKTKTPFELNSVLNDPEGKWIGTHGINRYRDWDELRYSLRSIEKHAATFRNKIQIIVNSVEGTEAGKQVPTWLNDDENTKEVVQVLRQEDFFDMEKHVCLPTFNSLTIENQLFNTQSDTDVVRQNLDASNMIFSNMKIALRFIRRHVTRQNACRFGYIFSLVRSGNGFQDQRL